MTDLSTGLMWQKQFHGGRKHTFAEAKSGAAQCKTGGHTDGRLPTLKELCSLIDFSGGMASQPAKPYLDTRYFEFIYGDPAKGEREIDAQYWSATEYVGLTMRGNATVFGVNFADGRIYNYVRGVRGGEVVKQSPAASTSPRATTGQAKREADSLSDEPPGQWPPPPPPEGEPPPLPEAGLGTGPRAPGSMGGPRPVIPIIEVLDLSSIEREEGVIDTPHGKQRPAYGSALRQVTLSPGSCATERVPQPQITPPPPSPRHHIASRDDWRGEGWGEGPGPIGPQPTRPVMSCRLRVDTETN